jgi:hypothetical protein
MTYAQERFEYSLLVSTFFALLKVLGAVDIAWGWVVSPIALCVALDAGVALITRLVGSYPEGFWADEDDGLDE